MNTLYNLGHNELVDLIAAVGHETSILVQGHIGAGKSSMLNTLAARLPGHHPVRFDAATKDLGDLQLPKMHNLEGRDYFTMATHEELGAHIKDRPVTLMIDEIGKANRSVQNGLLTVLHERYLGSHKLHPESIVFATTNLGGEGVGDLMQAHALDRIMVVEARKPTVVELVEHGINKGWEPIVLGWLRENPHAMQDYREVKDPEENPIIFHPRAVGRNKFVTPRSLEKASNLLKQRGNLPDSVVTAGLIGTIGTRAALDMMAFVKLADKLPTLKSIKETPETAPVPDNPAAQTMVIFRALSTLERDWMDAWMTYLCRMPAECQGIFANGVRAKGYSKQGMVMTHRGFTQWAMEKSYLFAADV